MPAMIEDFRIRIDDAVLADLRHRLARTRWSSARSDDWKLGTSRPYLEALVAHWSSGYNWRAQEAQLDRLPQFVTELDGTRLHFVHQRARDSDARPLLLLHGWPDSFHRFHKVIPRLTAPGGGEAFDVVVPSLPGFGFSGPARSNRHTAQLLWRLMTEVLGHRRFLIAGGDGGSVLAQIMAIDHPGSVAGIHITDLGWHIATIDPARLSRPERKYLDAQAKAFMAAGAYAAVQSTRPNSLAAALNDSPVGLAAWIVDRFQAWCDGGIEHRLTSDEVLTNIMIYWVTQTIGSSMATYRAEARSPSLTPAQRVDVPVGVALFPADPAGIPPRALAEHTLNVQRWTEMPRGGHFAALEEPELFVAELTSFFATLSTTRSEQERPRDVHPAV